MATNNSSAPDEFDDENVVRTWVTGFSQNIADNLDRVVGFVPPDAGYFPPNSEWLQYPARRTRLVRLDVAVYAVHLAAARVFLRPIPHLQKKAMEKTKELLLAGGGQVSTFVFLKKALGFTVRLFIDLVEVWRTENRMRDLEQSIRIAFGKTMREVNGLTLPQGRGQRRRKSVASRHPSKKQRRANRRG